MTRACLLATVILAATLTVAGADGSAALAAGAPAGNPFELAGPPAAAELTPLDKLVFAPLEKLGIRPANLCSDAVFLRRAYLDVIGTLPTEQEAREFLSSRNPNKRGALIDRLLGRDEFATYWAMKWSDLLRVKAEFPINLWPNAAQAYHRWIRDSIQANKPCDRFVRELLTASGSNFRVPPANFYRAMQDREPRGIAQAVALTFMGARADKWPKERLDGMAAFFAQVAYKCTGEWKEEIVFFDPGRTIAPTTGVAPLPAPMFPDGTRPRIEPGRDPRAAFADWLLDAKNPWFARNIANRAWSWLLGRGIVHEPDDIRPDNPPANPELLAYLERELVAGGYDLKRLFRLILMSETYQLSCVATSNRPEAVANFAHYPLRRLEAEVLIDALCQITGTTEKYTSAIPEPFTFIPESQRSIALQDGSISSPFLELFGRSPRDTGLESERTARPTAAQRLHLLNSSQVQRKIEQGRKAQALLSARGSQAEIATSVYLTILSRYPTEAELKTVAAYAQAPTTKPATTPATTRPAEPSAAGRAGSSGASRQAGMDLIWALINSAEFLYRH